MLKVGDNISFRGEYFDIQSIDGEFLTLNNGLEDFMIRKDSIDKDSRDKKPSIEEIKNVLNSLPDASLFQLDGWCGVVFFPTKTCVSLFILRNLEDLHFGFKIKNDKEEILAEINW